MSTVLQTKRSTWAVRVILVLVSIIFSGAIMKLTHHPMVVEGFAKIGIPQAAMLPIGIVEVACVILYLIPRTAILGTFLLTGYLGGAVMTNIIAHTDFLHALAIGLLVWAGAWLRVPELRALLPLRKSRPQLEVAEPVAATRYTPPADRSAAR